jgi:hypothetical protein
MTLSGSFWEQSCSRYKPEDPCFKHAVNRGMFTVPGGYDEAPSGTKHPYSFWIGVNNEDSQVLSINFENIDLDELPDFANYADQLSGTIELPDSTQFAFERCLFTKPNSKFPKGAIQCFKRFEDASLFNNLSSGPNRPFNVFIDVPKSLSNYQLVKYGLQFDIPALDPYSIDQLTFMQNDYENRRKAELAAKAEKDTQETQKREAEIARKQEAERATQARYSAVSGPGFEETIRWLHDNLNKRPRWICKDKTDYGFVRANTFYCYSADFALNAECKVTITSTHTYNYANEESRSYDQYKKTSTVYEFPNFGYAETLIGGWNYLYGELIYDIGYDGTLKRQKDPAASSQLMTTKMTVSSRAGGIIKQTDDILKYDWEDISSDPSVYNWQRTSKRNSLHQEVSSAKNIYLGFNPDMGKRVQTALNKYSEHCRVRFPEKTSLF